MTIDSKDLGTVDGFDIGARLEQDDHLGNPLTEFGPEVCDAEMLEAWRSGEWSFVGLVVTASKRGHVLGTSSLWGMEYGWFEGRFVDPLQYEADGAIPALVEDAVDMARHELAALTGTEV